MSGSARRISAMFLRYLYLHKRSVSRTLELVFWPVMELLVWGFVTLYIKSLADGSLAQVIVFLINAIIFWDILYRSQQGVSISFIEDIWTHNIINLLISPLKLWEWLTATFLYGAAKTILITMILSFLALVLYSFNLVSEMGFYLVLHAANLLFFGWTLGVATSGLLLRWGHAVEALIWGIPFLIQPLSAIYYPLSVLPPWLQNVSLAIPSTYVFEGMRDIIKTGRMDLHYFFISFGINLVCFAAASAFFIFMYYRSRASGRLGRLGMD